MKKSGIWAAVLRGIENVPNGGLIKGEEIPLDVTVMWSPHPPETPEKAPYGCCFAVTAEEPIQAFRPLLSAFGGVEEFTPEGRWEMYSIPPSVGGDLERMKAALSRLISG